MPTLKSLPMPSVTPQPLLVVQGCQLPQVSHSQNCAKHSPVPKLCATHKTVLSTHKDQTNGLLPPGLRYTTLSLSQGLNRCCYDSIPLLYTTSYTHEIKRRILTWGGYVVPMRCRYRWDLQWRWVASGFSLMTDTVAPKMSTMRP